MQHETLEGRQSPRDAKIPSGKLLRQGDVREEGVLGCALRPTHPLRVDGCEIRGLKQLTPVGRKGEAHRDQGKQVRAPAKEDQPQSRPILPPPRVERARL